MSIPKNQNVDGWNWKKKLMKKNLKKQSTSKMRRVCQKLRGGSCERDNTIDDKIWKKMKSNSKKN